MHIREADSGEIPALSDLIRDAFRDVAEAFGLTGGLDGYSLV